MPLETAEQFLLTLGSISNLEARLKLWTFKLDFKVGVKPCKQFQYLINWKVMEKDICEPYRALKDGLKAVQNSEVKIKVAQQLF